MCILFYVPFESILLVCVTITGEGLNLDLHSVPTVLSRERFLSNHRCDTRLSLFDGGGGCRFFGGWGLLEGSSQLVDFYDKHGN